MPHALRNVPLLVGLVKCGHAAKTLAVHKRHYDFITNSPEIDSHVWRVFLFLALVPCVNAFNR